MSPILPTIEPAQIAVMPTASPDNAALDALTAMWAAIFQQQVLPPAEATTQGTWEGTSEAKSETDCVSSEVEETQATETMILGPNVVFTIANFLGSTQAFPAEQMGSTPDSSTGVSSVQEGFLKPSPSIDESELGLKTDVSAAEPGSSLAGQSQLQQPDPVQVISEPAQLAEVPPSGFHSQAVSEPQPLKQLVERGTVNRGEKQSRTGQSASELAVQALLEKQPGSNSEQTPQFETAITLRKQIQELHSPIEVPHPPLQQPVAAVENEPEAQVAEDVSAPSAGQFEDTADQVELPVELSADTAIKESTASFPISTSPEETTTRSDAPPASVEIAFQEPVQMKEPKPSQKPAVNPRVSTPKEIQPPPTPQPSRPGESKTISIRIPLTDMASDNGRAARHIDLIFQQKNLDLTVQFQSPTVEIQRTLDESMPKLMEQLKGENWAARPVESLPTFSAAVDGSVEARRRLDSTFQFATPSNALRETTIVSQSSSQSFSFEDQSSGRHGSSQQENQRNRKKLQAFQNEFDEQQES